MDGRKRGKEQSTALEEKAPSMARGSSAPRGREGASGPSPPRRNRSWHLMLCAKARDCLRNNTTATQRKKEGTPPLEQNYVFL